MGNLEVIGRMEPAPVGTVSAGMMQQYLEYVDVSPRSASTYKRNIKQLGEYFRESGITQPARRDILNFRQYLAEVKGLKATTVQSYLTTAKLFFKWTAMAGLYPNIADNIKGVKISKEPKRSYLTAEQMKDVLKTSAGSSEQELRDAAMIALMASSGLRTIEVVRADVSDLRPVGGTVMLFVQGKGRNDKTGVRVAPKVMAKISAYLKARKAKDNEPLFTAVATNYTGNRMTTRSISRICKNHMKQAGIDTPFHTAHSLRHTAVTLAINANEDLMHVQQMARHSKTDTTLIYIHSLQAEQNTCSESAANQFL